MNEKIIVLQPKDLDTKQILNKRQNTQQLTLNYRNKIYERLNIFFNKSARDRALEYCRRSIDERKTHCLLVQEEIGFSVWSEIQTIAATEIVGLENSINNESSILTTSTVSNYGTQASLFIVQIIADEIEYLMGLKQKKAFVRELVEILHKSNLPATDSLKKIEILFGLDPMQNDGLPIWRQEDIDYFLSQIAMLGIKYFGNTSFVYRTVDYLKQLPIYKKAEFMHCVGQFLSLA
jgi:hypothetical protein